MRWNGKACFRIRFCFEGTDHVWNIQRRKRSKRWGEIPVSSQAELKSIALEEVEEIQSNAFSWIDPTQQ
jgi:hypothetical protein